MMRSLPPPLALSWFLLAGLASSSPPSNPPPEDVVLTLRRPAILGLITGATPYRLETGSTLLRETLTFTDPRDLSFQDARITFAIRCRGTPFPVDQVLRPVLALRAAGSGYQAVVESLPVTIPGFGTVDLKDVVQPVPIQSLLRQTVLLQGKPAQLDLQVQRITIRPEQIEVAARLTLTPTAK